MTKHSSTVTEEELLPCPLCHCKGDRLMRGICYPEGSADKEAAVQCPTCGCRATLKAWQSRRPAQLQPDPLSAIDVAEDDPDVILVAHAIAEHGVGRPWDDFLPTNAFDLDHGDLTEYARAAVAALRAKASAVPSTDGNRGPLIASELPGGPSKAMVDASYDRTLLAVAGALNDDSK